MIDVVTDDGAVLHARAYGPADGLPIVLVHGWSCSIEYWYPQINTFAEESGKYRVIAYDLRGHGRSTPGTRVFDTDVLADDLQAVLEATVTDPERKATVVGHSMGGMSIMAWADRHSDKVDRYASSILLASTATDNLIGEASIVRYPKVPLPIGRAIIGAPWPIASTPVTNKAVQYITMAPRSKPDDVQFCRDILAGCQPRTRGGWGVALSGLDLRRGLKSITVPTTVLGGSVDRLLPIGHSRRLARTLDETGVLQRLIVLPGIGHMSTVEDSESVSREIERLRSTY
ncbi:MAG: alpha/beta hydrolase [Rhodococcus sp.]|nr:alpha/beta hydrolase [Rhodococcus sp. (in: high G+C Gram-positive bacteria)]